jgi:hypothetical protein
MNQVELYGQTLTAADLRAACLRALDGHAMVPMALYPMAGAQWLRELIDVATEPPLRSALDRTLTGLLAELTGEPLQGLAAALESRPGHVPADALMTALARTVDAPVAARRSLARAVASEVMGGEQAYDVALRAYAGEVAVRNWLAPAMLCFDHAWTLQQLPTWFTGDLDADDDLLVCLSGRLSRGELRALLHEAQAAGFPPEALAALTEFVERVANLPQFVDRGDGVRWI